MVRARRRSDVTVAMASTGYNAVLNACKSIASTDPSICQPGTLACQKTAVTGAAFKAMARAIATSSYDGSVFCCFALGSDMPDSDPS